MPEHFVSEDMNDCVQARFSFIYQNIQSGVLSFAAFLTLGIVAKDILIAIDNIILVVDL